MVSGHSAPVTIVVTLTFSVDLKLVYGRVSIEKGALVEQIVSPRIGVGDCSLNHTVAAERSELNLQGCVPFQDVNSCTVSRSPPEASSEKREMHRCRRSDCVSKECASPARGFEEDLQRKEWINANREEGRLVDGHRRVVLDTVK